MTRFFQICTLSVCPLTKEERDIDFGVDPSSISVSAIASALHLLVCAISYEPVGMFLLNMHGYIQDRMKS